MKDRDSPPAASPGDRPVAQEVNSSADYAPDEVEFLLAMERYKRERHRPFPTWSEVLAVLKGLGYRKPTNAPRGPE
jgi:hypothetical protein